MAGDLFSQALSFTLGQEGGWADLPDDPGGSTMEGITLVVFQAWLHDPSATPDMLRAITDAEVASILRGLYWNPVAGGSLWPGVGLAVFDSAVQHGVRRAAFFLQQSCGADQDGAIGPQTITAAGRVTPGVLITRIMQIREAFYRQCADFPEFGVGWLRRNQACYRAALAAAGLPAPTT